MQKLVTSMVLALICHHASSREEPLWEVGAGLAAVDMAHYLGADQSQSYALPAPYFVYRGKYLQADRSGMRAQLYDGDRWDLRFTGGASLPVDSDDNRARRGMDDLDLIVEFGPSLHYQLLRQPQQLLRAELPVRAAFSLGNQFMHHTGWTINPRLYYRYDWQDWSLSSTLGPVFSDRRYHGYIYDVDQHEATALRPEYSASGGYTGTRFSLGVRRRYEQWYIGAFASYHNLDGAQNSDSPLLLEQHSATFAFVVAWVFGESSQTVESFERD